MTSPPLRVTRPRRVDDVDRVLEEPDAAVAHQDVDAAGVEREELVVGAGVIARGAERAGGDCPGGRARTSGRNLLFGPPETPNDVSGSAQRQ